MGIPMWWRRTEEVVNFVQDYYNEKKGGEREGRQKGQLETLRDKKYKKS